MKQLLKAYVIDLEKRPRWGAECVALLGGIGVVAEIFWGVDGRDASIDHGLVVHHFRFRARSRRMPLPGEIGCYASHVAFCRAVCKGEVSAVLPDFEDWFLVFEDDVIPSPSMDVEVLIKSIKEASSNGFDFVFLHAGRGSARLNSDWAVLEQAVSEIYTHACLINRKAAARISKWEMFEPVDLAISKAKSFKKGVLWGAASFRQRPRATAPDSIHHERSGRHRKRTPAAVFDAAFAPFASHSVMLGCDKNTRHSYGPMYENLLKDFIGKEVSLLEIGVMTGASLSGWKNFLGPQAKVKGVDVDLGRLAYHDVAVDCADATDPVWSRGILDASFDIIIDDGSHVPSDQHSAFLNLESKLKSGGIYVIEDIQNLDQFSLLFADVDYDLLDFRANKKCRDDVCAVIRKPLNASAAFSFREKRAREVVVADCVFGPARGLGNKITVLCSAYASAKVRGADLVVAWRANTRCGAEWEDLFLPLEGVEFVRSLPSTGLVHRAAFYSDKTKHQHIASAGKGRYTAAYWDAWREIAARIQILPELKVEVPEGGFPAISLRLNSPPGSHSDWWLPTLPDMQAPFVATDSEAGLEMVRRKFPDAWSVCELFQKSDTHPRGLEKVRNEARDMMLLCKASRIFAVGRESTFRNLAHIGYGVPVLKCYAGPAP